MDVRFRDFDPFNCWIWLRFAHPPGSGERGYVETAFDSWFFLGKCGACKKTGRNKQKATTPTRGGAQFHLTR